MISTCDDLKLETPGSEICETLYVLKVNLQLSILLSAFKRAAVSMKKEVFESLDCSHSVLQKSPGGVLGISCHRDYKRTFLGLKFLNLGFKGLLFKNILLFYRILFPLSTEKLMLLTISREA